MAKAVLSKYFSKLSGSVDGLNFVHTSEGTVMASTPESRNYPRTPAQVAQQDRITRASRGWATLSALQVQEWNRFAALTRTLSQAEERRKNGYLAYASLSTVWYAVPGNAGSAPKSPPGGTFVGDAISVTAVASGGSVTFTGSGPTSAGVVVEFWLQPLRNANRRPAKGGYHVVGYSALEVGDGNEFEVVVAPGVHAGRYRFIETASGRKTSFTDIPVTGVALGIAQGGADEAPKAAVRKKAA